MSGKSRKLLVFSIGYTLELTAIQLLDRAKPPPAAIIAQDVHNLVAVQQEMH
jgi:hypothetical protein